MISVKDSNAMAEVIYYLKGIKQEDINKIPKKLIQYLTDNASKEYKCNFDYNKPLKDLDLIDETRGIIGMICYNYWCVNKIQKEQYLKKLSENEKNYQKKLYEKYNPDNIFKNREKNTDNISSETAIVEYKEKNFIQKIFDKIRHLFKRD